MAITEATFTAANWEFYAKRIRDNYVARTCLETCRKVCGELTADNASELVSRLSGLASGILDSAGTGGRVVFGDIVSEYVKDMDYRMQHRGELAGYDTGLNNLNEMLNGLQSEYIIIAARPSMGKTALGEQIALKIAEREKVCFWELEMGEKMMFERAVSLSSGVEMNKLKSAFMSEMQLNAVMGKIQSLGTNENFILRTGTRNIDEIVTATRAEVLSRGCKAVFIDHAGLISTSGSYRATWESYVEISHKLQELQRELNVPVVVLSQLGRPAEGAKTTTMANIKGSGAFEEDADVIIAIERERAKTSNEFQIPTVLNVQKNRNGPTGHVYAVFMPQKVKFVDGKKPEENDGTGEAKKAV
jgi:replicative DNA helicase